MRVSQKKIPDVLIVEPKVFGDERGLFFESFNQKAFNDAVGREIVFVQDNHSMSVKKVLRGLQYQLPPKAQGKLVRVVQGEVFDVAVDIRNNSETYGLWVGEILSAENKRQMWIPPGFAHGFLTLSEKAEFLYKTTEYYYPDLERCIRWDDSSVAVMWPCDNPILSEKDRCANPLGYM